MVEQIACLKESAIRLDAVTARLIKSDDPHQFDGSPQQGNQAIDERESILRGPGQTAGAHPKIVTFAHFYGHFDVFVMSSGFYYDHLTLTKENLRLKNSLTSLIRTYSSRLTLWRQTLLFFVGALALLLTIYGLSAAPPSQAQTDQDSFSSATLQDAEPADPFNRLHMIQMENGQVVESSAVDLSLQEISSPGGPGESVKKRAQGLAQEQPPQKIHPLLNSQLEAVSNGLQFDQPMEVVITFVDKMKMPRFPSPNPQESRESLLNQLAVSRATRMAEQIQSAREGAYQQLAAELKATYGAEVTETFWLINGVVAEMPLSAVRSLAAREDVMYIEPKYSGESPPADANNLNDVDDGRGRIVSDPYFNVPGLDGGFIGLLDTGVRATHTLLSTNLSIRLDCTQNNAQCTGGNPADTCDHGTSSASIISGNGNLGAAFRGVTDITLDSFNVYTSCGLNSAATVRGFQRAVAVGDRVIVAETQGGGGATSAISVAADAAFDAGAVIIAANGNASQVSEVGSPAAAHKVIGVGAVHVQTLATISQIAGPVADGRTKPDIQAPTNTETGGFASDTTLKVFTGTSGATPYAAGGAALLRNWLRGTNVNIDPGQIYAHLINAGQTVPFNNTNGAGLINLPVNGPLWSFKTSVNGAVTVTFPIQVNAGNNRLDAAIWWPETAAQAHNDIDLSLVDPGGVVRATGASVSSVFERVRVSGPIAAGTWTVRVRGFSVPVSPQTVYFAAHARP